MRWNFGSVYKEIRKGKNISQNDICKENISRTTLSKLENSKIMPSYQTMDFLLKQINMSFDEFTYVCKSFEIDQREQIIQSFYKLSANTNISTLAELKSKCILYLKTNEDLFIEDILSILDSQLKLVDDNIYKISCLSKIYVNSVWQKIEKANTWYYSELRLLNCILYFLPLETVRKITPKIIESMKKYEDYKKSEPFYISLLLNTGTIYFMNNMVTDAEVLVNKALPLIYSSKRYDFLGIAEVRLGIYSKDITRIKKGISFLKFAGEDSIVTELLEEVAFAEIKLSDSIT